MRAFAEWEKQEFLLVALPHKNSDWNEYLDEILASYREFISAVARFQKVLVITPNASDFDRICSDIENVEWIDIDTNDTWIRDYGAIDVENDGEILSYNFIFNAWGGKFSSEKDNALNHQLFNKIDGKLKDIDLILEGGSIDFNGHGVMLTTTTCLLNDNRNSHLNKDELDSKLKELFGLDGIIWLENGFIYGDDTDSHVDTLARFIGENLVAVTSTDDESDIHYEALKKMKNELVNQGFEILELPLPSPVFYEGRRLGATYANFIFINGALIVPTYGDKNDEIIIKRLQKALPDREIIPVDARVFIRQNGSLHCSSQNKFIL